jgi:hypothetical protein
MQITDLHHNLKISPAIDPAAIIAGNATKTSATIDRQGFDSLEFAIYSGVLTDASYTTTLYEGDAADMSDEAAAADSDLLGTEALASFALADDSTVKKIGYTGIKRYVRIKVVQADATTGGFLSAIAIQGNPHNAPVA